MDGREFVNMPPLGLSGLSLEPGRVSSGNTGGRLMPSTGQLPSFCATKYYPSPLGLHSQSGFPHLSRSVYHSYVPVSHLEPPGGGTPLLTRMGQHSMGQHSMIDPQKDGFCFVGHQSAYHPQTSVLRTSANQTQSLHENDPLCNSFKNYKDTSRDSKEKVFRSEVLLTPSLLSTAKKDRRFSEETQSGDLSDRELDSKVEKERKKIGLHRVPKQGEHHSSFVSEFMPNRWSGNIEGKSKHLQMSHLRSHGGESFSKSIGSAEDKCIKQPSRHDENLSLLCHTNLNQTKLGDSVVTPDKNLSTQCTCPSSHPVNFYCKVASTTPLPAQPVHSSMYSIIQRAKEPTNEVKTLAPNFGSTIEISDEHSNHGTQAGNFNGKELRKPEEKAQFSHSLVPQDLLLNETKRADGVREQGSVICCNSSLKGQGVSDSNNHGHVSLEKKIFDSNAESIHCGQEDCTKETCKMSGFLNFHRQDPGNIFVKHPEEKSKQLDAISFTNSQITVSATQHSHGKEEETKLCIESKNLGTRKTNVDATHPSSHCERSAMQNLIKYSGNFEKETAVWQSSGKKSPFGGLGNMRLDETQLKEVKVHSLSQPEVKRDPDRTESAKTLAKDSLSFQGEIEVRNPPVGIAVAVARQKDNGGNKMLSNKGHTREESMDERIRHCNERLLLERLDREHAKLLRENKDLPDISQMHPAGCAAIGLSPNLMVTGGTALSGPWTPDSTSHLAAHAWFSSGVMPCMWHAEHPYGLAHPSLHQGINPSVSPGVATSFSSACNFVREPRSGQIVVIPAEHISHFAEILDRTTPFWPSMYSPAHTSMQHAHQLQLFSQQHLMRQHELYMLLQQQAVHSIDIHRGAQLDGVESPRTEQTDILDLQRNADILELQRNAQLEAKEFQRKAHHDSQDCHRNEQLTERLKAGQEKVVDLSLQNNKESSLCRSPSNSSGKVFGSSPLHLKSFSATKKLQEESDKHTKQRSFSSVSPISILPTKLEVSRSAKDEDIKAGDSSPLQDPTHGYSVQCFSPSVQHQLSYISQPTNVESAESLASVIKLSELKAGHIETPLDLKSVHLFEEFKTAEPTTDAIKSDIPVITSCKISNDQDVCTASVECQHFFQETESLKAGGKEDERKIANLSFCTSEINLGIGKGTCSTQTDFIDTFESPNNEMDLVTTPQHVERSPKTNDVKDLFMINGSTCTDSVTSESVICKEEEMCYELSDVKCITDPLAGMNALVAASEMPEACCLPPRSTAVLVPDIQAENTLLQGIVLLSEIAEIELDRRKQMDNLPSCHIRPSLESLLAASSQMLMEVLSSPTLDCLKAESIKLPRELTLNKKYSWKQDKSSPHFSIASAIEDMDSVEIDCRVRLAELQKQYKEKQRELAKLQRRRDSEEKSDENIKTLTKRGPGRPKKRKHGINLQCHSQERMNNNRKLSKCILLSERTKAGDCIQRTLLNFSEVDELERKSGIDDWEEHSSASSYVYEFTDQCQEKQRDGRSRRRNSEFRPMHSIPLSRIAREDTDSDDDDSIIRNEWLSQPKSLRYSMCKMLTQKMKILGCSPSPQHMSSFYRTSKSKQTHRRNRHLCLLLPDQEAESSFSDSTEDSLDQGY